MKHSSCRSLCLAALVAVLAGSVPAREALISTRKTEKNIEKMEKYLEWGNDLEALQSQAAENGKLVFWMQLVGDLDDGL